MIKLSIRNRILANFGLILLIMLAIGSFSHWQLATIDEHASEMKTGAIPGLAKSTQIADAIWSDYILNIDQFVQPDPKVKQRNEPLLADQQAKIAGLIADYKRTIFTDAERRKFTKFEISYSEYRRAAVELLSDGIDSNNLDQVTNQMEQHFDPAFRSAVEAIKEVSNDNQQRATASISEIGSETHSLRTSVIMSFALALAVALISAFFLLRAITAPLARLTVLMDAMRQGDFTQRMEIERQDELGELAGGFNRMADEVMGLVGQVQRSGIRVSTSMTEIAATSKQQQATATEVAATTTQIGATSREIAATSKELVRTINEVSTVAEHTAGLATSGQSGLTQMEETMGHVMEAASSINAKLGVLNEKASDISQVVTTITKVADQTNLLSLNAAIEAEKAGEYGRGFSVVSSEIRRLADQTAVATYDIEEMVKDIQAAVSAGVMGMDKFSEEVRRGLHDVHEIGGKLSEIISQVLALVPRFETVSDGMEAQASGAEQISEALVQLTEATQQTVASLRQSSSAIDELNEVSGDLHGSIARFKLAA